MEFEVDLDKHHLEGLAAKPTTALLELIWNALDADAEHVEVAFGRNELEGIEEIRVTDDGHGMAQADAEAAFRSLGASWKLDAAYSRSGTRLLHGKHGRGRFRAAGMGQAIRWETVAEESGLRFLVTIEIRSDNLRRVQISNAEPTDRPVGTKVVISGISGPLEGLGEDASDKLLAHLAIYIEKYRPTIVYDRETLDPSTIQEHRATYELDTNGDTAQLDVIEWSRPVDRALCLCNPDGMALSEVPPGIRAPGFDFTAYLRWSGFAEENRVLVAELDPESGEVGAAACTGPIADA